MSEKKPTDPVQQINLMFIVFTIILVFGIAEVYQTAALIKLTKALEANSQQNKELIEISTSQTKTLRGLSEEIVKDEEKIRELEEKLNVME